MVTAAAAPRDTVPDCTAQTCNEGVAGIRDALYVLGGKWKLPLIFTLSGGALRFRDIQRSLGGITAKILSRELKDLELNGFVIRMEEPTTTTPAISYKLTPYSRTLHKVTYELAQWGTQHRQYIGASKRK